LHDAADHTAIIDARFAPRVGRQPMRDGLPKLKDFPKEFGGSGEAVAE
jgi:hypothetical protein